MEDSESLPSAVDFGGYRAVLWNEAVRLISLPRHTLPWYLEQQALLFIAVSGDIPDALLRTSLRPETEHYQELICFLGGHKYSATAPDFSTLAILARRSFLSAQTALQLSKAKFNAPRITQIAQRDPSFALELLRTKPKLLSRLPTRLRDDLSIDRNVGSGEWKSLAEIVLNGKQRNGLRNEIGILRFAEKFLKAWSVTAEAAITPSNIALPFDCDEKGLSEEGTIRIIPSRAAPARIYVQSTAVVRPRRAMAFPVRLSAQIYSHCPRGLYKNCSPEQESVAGYLSAAR